MEKRDQTSSIHEIIQLKQRQGSIATILAI